MAQITNNAAKAANTTLNHQLDRMVAEGRITKDQTEECRIELGYALLVAETNCSQGFVEGDVQSLIRIGIRFLQKWEADHTPYVAAPKIRKRESVAVEVRETVDRTKPTEIVTIVRYNYESKTLEKVRTPYSGIIPGKAVTAFSYRFLKEYKEGRFYPHPDPLELYQEGLMRLTQCAQNLPVLKTATPETYLNKAGYLILLGLHNKEVAPLREDYRAVEALFRKKETAQEAAKSVDAFDEENWDPIESLPVSTAMQEVKKLAEAEADNVAENAAQTTLADFGEKLESEECDAYLYRWLRAKKKVQQVKQQLQLTLKDQAEPILKAFDAYIDCNGNLFAAAHTLNIPKSTFYRKWEKYLFVTKKVWEKTH